jgi:putative membrane protein
MLVVSLILVGIAALVHVYIFVLESLRWTEPSTRKTFGTSELEAETTLGMAYNQGFYNLFLAIGTIVGIVFLITGSTGIGAALVFASAGSMLLASLVLITSDRTKARPAVVQGLPPLLGLIALVIALAL